MTSRGVTFAGFAVILVLATALEVYARTRPGLPPSGAC